MKQIVLTTLLLLGGLIVSAQEFAHTETYAKNVITAIQKPKKESLIIISKTEMRNLMQSFLESMSSQEGDEFTDMMREQFEEMNFDSLRDQLAADVKKTLARIREKLEEDNISLKSLKFASVKFEIEQDDFMDMIQGSFKVYATSSDSEEPILFKLRQSIYYNGTWYTGDDIAYKGVQNGMMDDLCECISPENMDTEKCRELIKEFEKVYEEMSDEERKDLEKHMMECMESYDYGEEEALDEEAAEEVEELEELLEEIEEEGAEEAIDEEMYFEEMPSEDPSDEMILGAYNELSKEMPDFCECVEKHNDPEWKEKCDEYREKIEAKMDEASGVMKKAYIEALQKCEGF